MFLAAMVGIVIPIRLWYLGPREARRQYPQHREWYTRTDPEGPVASEEGRAGLTQDRQMDIRARMALRGSIQSATGQTELTTYIPTTDQDSRERDDETARRAPMPALRLSRPDLTSRPRTA